MILPNLNTVINKIERTDDHILRLKDLDMNNIQDKLMHVYFVKHLGKTDLSPKDIYTIYMEEAKKIGDLTMEDRDTYAQLTNLYKTGSEDGITYKYSYITDLFQLLVLSYSDRLPSDKLKEEITELLRSNSKKRLDDELLEFNIFNDGLRKLTDNIYGVLNEIRDSLYEKYNVNKGLNFNQPRFELNSVREIFDNLISVQSISNSKNGIQEDETLHLNAYKKSGIKTFVLLSDLEVFRKRKNKHGKILPEIIFNKNNNTYNDVKPYRPNETFNRDDFDLVKDKET